MRAVGWISLAQAGALEEVQGGSKDPRGVFCKEPFKKIGQRQAACDACDALLGWRGSHSLGKQPSLEIWRGEKKEGSVCINLTQNNMWLVFSKQEEKKKKKEGRKKKLCQTKCHFFSLKKNIIPNLIFKIFLPNTDIFSSETQRSLLSPSTVELL